MLCTEILSNGTVMCVYIYDMYTQICYCLFIKLAQTLSS